LVSILPPSFYSDNFLIYIFRWYPFSDRTYKACLGIVQFVAPKGIVDWFTGVKNLLPYALGTMLNPWSCKGAPVQPRSKLWFVIFGGVVAAVAATSYVYFNK